MYELKLEDSFKKDVNYWKKQVPELQEELLAIFDVIAETGKIPVEYDPHLLVNPDLPYTGTYDFICLTIC